MDKSMDRPKRRTLALVCALDWLLGWARAGALAMSIAASIAMSIALALVPSPALAQDYPARPVHIIVGFIPGSAADITARVLGQGMGRLLGQQFIVENKPGAASSLAADFVAHAPKDGYTLFLGSSANITNAAINPNLAFDMAKDFVPIALVTSVAVILVVHPSLGVSSVEELIALAKAKPGGLLYASTGVGAAPHLAAELFAMRSGVKLVHVPYQGSPQAVTDLIAGRTVMMFSPASAVIPQVEAGKLKALASAAAKRPSIAPDLPTMAEAGIPDFDTSIWFGLMAPAGTPREIVDKLARAADETLRSNEALTSLKAQGFDTLSGGPDDFARTIGSEIKRWGAVAQAAGLKK
jgi:tripartite-type tricarboxylate transporter receptor subunit TctC